MQELESRYGAQIDLKEWQITLVTTKASMLHKWQYSLTKLY